ncbi:MAG: hydroxyacid dehydrogenase [Chloroflexi bacterium]|nr:hydroxyacid dehydrogenase [Chloroflexota bacterium]
MTGRDGIPRGLILTPFAEGELGRLRARLDVQYESWMESRRMHDPEELAGKLNGLGASVLVVELDFVFEDVFEAVPSLRFVGVCRGATSQVDIEAATANGVAVVNTPGRNAQAVAEHALGLMLSLARRIPEGHSYVKGGRWRNPVGAYVELRGVELRGRTLGIVGLGAVGRRLAEIAGAIGMECIASDPHVVVPPEGVCLKDLDEVLVDSDFVSIHAPLTGETEGLFDSRRLALMKRTAYLVNLSDARIVDRDSLVDALVSRAIAGGAFDVFETHPIAPDHPLLRQDNVVLTPHVGGATEETIGRYSKMMTDEILRFLNCERPVNLINPDVWEEH